MNYSGIISEAFNTLKDLEKKELKRSRTKVHSEKEKRNINKKSLSESLKRKKPLKETFKSDDIIDDLLDRAKSWISDGYDKEEAVERAIDDGLIYTKDILDLAEVYLDVSKLLGEFYEDLYNDLLAKLDDELDESKKKLKEGVAADETAFAQINGVKVSAIGKYHRTRQYTHELLDLEINGKSASGDYRWMNRPWERFSFANAFYEAADELGYGEEAKQAVKGSGFGGLKGAVEKFAEIISNKEDNNLKEDTIKRDNQWVNKGKEGTHGKFRTKKEADAQRKAMFANGYEESLKEEKEVTTANIEIVKKFKDLDDGRIHVIGKKINKSDTPYCIGLGYDPERKSWSQGIYDFKSVEEAEKYLRTKAYDHGYNVEEISLTENKDICNEDLDSKKPYVVVDYYGKEIASFDYPGDAQSYVQKKTFASDKYAHQGYHWLSREEFDKLNKEKPNWWKDFFKDLY